MAHTDRSNTQQYQGRKDTWLSCTLPPGMSHKCPFRHQHAKCQGPGWNPNRKRQRAQQTTRQRKKSRPAPSMNHTPPVGTHAGATKPANIFSAGGAKISGSPFLPLSISPFRRREVSAPSGDGQAPLSHQGIHGSRHCRPRQQSCLGFYNGQ